MAPWILLFALAQTADASTSCVAFSRGAIEANALMPSSCSGVVLVKAGITAGYAVATRPLVKRHPKLMRWVTIGVAVVPAVAAVHNWRQIRRLP